MKVHSRKIKSIASKIRHARKNMGITQEKLAEMTGLSTGYIAFIEQGKRIPSINTTDKIARVLGIKLSDLFE